jgi:hypothetical protein
MYSENTLNGMGGLDDVPEDDGRHDQDQDGLEELPARSWHRLGLRLGGGLAGGRRRRAALQGQQERDQVEVLLG